jgi:hypothetical protein
LTPRGEKGTSRYIPEVGEAPFFKPTIQPARHKAGFSLGDFQMLFFVLNLLAAMLAALQIYLRPMMPIAFCANFAALAGEAAVGVGTQSKPVGQGNARLYGTCVDSPIHLFLFRFRW